MENSEETKEIISEEQKPIDLEVKEEPVQKEDSVEKEVDAPKVEDNTSKPEEKGFFKYYIFILLNSIIGFILMLYFSRQVITTLAEKNIIDLSNLRMVASVGVSAISAMIFMFLTLVFKKFFKKLFFSEIFLYIYIGGLTTLINIIAWNFFFKLVGKIIVSENIAWKVAEAIAFVIAVLFAFFADKLVVFKSYSFRPSKLFVELGSFIGARLITELINVAIMYFIIDYKGKEPLLGKIVASVVVIIVNYLFSKFIIFKKTENKNETQDK